MTQALAETGSAWYDDSVTDAALREAVQLRTDVHLGATHFSDRLADGGHAVWSVLEAGGTLRLLDNKPALDATTSIALATPARSTYPPATGSGWRSPQGMAHGSSRL